MTGETGSRPSSSRSQPSDRATISKPLQQIHAQLSWLARHSDIRFEPVLGTAARFELLVPFCYDILRWQVEFQRLRDSWVPDFTFSDLTFNPLLSRLPEAEGVIERLKAWNNSDEKQLHSLMKRLIPGFMAHQKLLIQNASATDSRLQFEFDTIVGGSGPERVQLLFVQGRSGAVSKAVFVVGIDGIQLGALRQSLAQTLASNDWLPSLTLEKLESRIFLRAVFGLRQGAAAPSLSLHISQELEMVAGRPRLPTWNSGMSLIEYIPELRESLQRHCNAAGVSAELRRNLLKELSAGKLGPPIELDVIGGRSAVFQMTHEACTHSLYIDLVPQFPDEQPCLTIQWDGEGIETSYQQYPWSPRWEAKEMAKRIYSFVKEQIQKHHKSQGS